MKIVLSLLLLFSCSAASSGLVSASSSGLVICDGNSLTAGSGATPEESYPELLKGDGVNAVNLGIPGQTSELMLENAKTKVDPLFEANAIVIFWEGINSFAVKEYSGAAGYDVLRQYVQGRKSVGFKTMVITMLPSRHPSHINIGMEKFRQEYNRLILENSAGADIVLDLSRDPRLENADDEHYFTTDKVHLNANGYRAVFENVEKTLKGRKK